MQIKGSHKGIYKLYSYARKQECLDAYRKKYLKIVREWEELKDAGTDPKRIKTFAGYSRATYYRAKKVLKRLERGIIPPSKKPKKLNKPKWGEAEKQLVLMIRRDSPTYGKQKIAVILKRDHQCTLSESTVGRILAYLLEKGLISKSRSAPRVRRTRDFSKGHAKRFTYKDYQKMQLGERVQIDHTTKYLNGVQVKHFQAWERKSKYIYARVFSRATSRCAKNFLIELLKRTPFPILSVQVDGGSEFRDEFEKACADLKLELIVLPPKSPKINGGVERGNRIFKEEFYASEKILADNIGAIQVELHQALKKYNNYRPHQALDGLTPIQYIQHYQLEASQKSQNA